MNLVKAEILWTRKCPLKCSFCAMARNDIPKAPIKKMVEGLKNLKGLGCRFIAIYGASPLYDFDGLPEFIYSAEKMGILTTVITDGIVKDHKRKLMELYDSGLRSLTVSYDFVPYDEASKTKSNKGWPLVEWFSKFPDIRDVEVVATITKNNYRFILSQLYSGMLKDYWFSFDFLHPDRGQSGTKCKGDGNNLLMKEEGIANFCDELLQMNTNIHQSNTLLARLREAPEIAAKFEWKCSNKEFPSWLTIDADGTVLPCDDFHTSRKFKVWNIAKEFTDFKLFYKKEVEEKCPGCFWTTHYDAWLIKKGQYQFENYIHKQK